MTAPPRSTIVVLASCVDEAARAFVSESADRKVLMVARDLSVPGWELRHSDPGRSKVMAAGRSLGTEDIGAVVCRLPRVIPTELVHVASQDREYLAAEGTALLAWWLSSLSCPVYNPPDTTCLTGPGLRPEQWVMTAARCGLQVEPLHRGTGQPVRPTAHRATRQVTIVDGRVVGSVPESSTDSLLKLIEVVQCRILHVEFVEGGDGWLFAGASPLPHLEDPEVRTVLDRAIDRAMDGP